MAYSLKKKLRSFVQVTVLCTLIFSANSAIHAQSNSIDSTIRNAPVSTMAPPVLSTSGKTMDSKAGNVSIVNTRGLIEAFEVTTEECTLTVSEGDANVGIASDKTCANGGVGCLNHICRLCQATLSPQSAHLQKCSEFTNTTTLCNQVASVGDAANGIDIITDTTCATGGLGCIDKVCRFCQKVATPQSSPYVSCAVIRSLTTPGSATLAPISSPAPVATTAPPIQTCTQKVSDGDAAVGINIVTDTNCSVGGVGCIDQVCRFCRETPTTQSALFVDCALIKDVSTTMTPATPAPPTSPSLPPTTSASPSIVFECFRTVSSGDKAVGLDIVSDIRCSEGGTGCVSDVCRFCKQFDTVQSQSYLNCSDIPSSKLGSDIKFVPIPIVDGETSPPASDSPIKTSKDTNEAATACTMTSSAGDSAVGIVIVTDTSCANGGTGCIDSLCRYCKTKDTLQSSHFNNCPVLTAPTSTTTVKGCTKAASDGDAAIGINIITDVNCQFGGLGCLDSVCRLCKTRATDQSAHLGSCSDYTVVTSPISATNAPTPAKTMEAPQPTMSPYSIPMKCYQSVSDGDKMVGLDIVTDLQCGDGGIGCLDSICRFCKRFETLQSHSYLNCSDIPPSDYGADINFKPIPVINDMEAEKFTVSDIFVGTNESMMIPLELNEPCDTVPLADGQAAGGIGVVLDTINCPKGLASGCTGDRGCRYCMRFPTALSENLEYCAVVNKSEEPYFLSGFVPSIDDDVGSARIRLVESGSAIPVKQQTTNLTFSKFVKTKWFAGVIACVGVVGIGCLTAFGIERMTRTLRRSRIKSANEAVIPDDDNRPSVLIASNVGEPGIISDV